MPSNPKKEKLVNSEDEKSAVNTETDIAGEQQGNAASEAPLAPFDPRLRKPGNEPLQANQDPLNGVNE